MRQPHLVQFATAELAGRLGADLAQDGRQGVGHRDHLVAEQQRALVDPALGVRLEPGRVHSSPPLRLAPGDQLPVVRGEHRGRHHRRTVDIDDPWRSFVRGEYGDRVGRAEVY
jgi:hypothetical protein